ncbi:MAG TPA: hypothetical protein VKV15_28810 [Bryobacteraceae bacterium]|nr:hypothetical protein [Bryobacteraceae bacterium]
MRTRRRFLQSTAAAALGAPTAMYAAAAKNGPVCGDAEVYRRLGVRPVINGVGVVTRLGGSIMPPEVVRAMDEASKHFVSLEELQIKSGEKLAELLGIPAALVTAGCASAITVGTAACVVEGDPSKLSRLPDTTGMKNEVIQLKAHPNEYEAQIRLVGAKIVYVETREELDKAINERTAMLFFLNTRDPDGPIHRDEWIRVGKERKVPTFNDAASDVPPATHLSEYVRQGFDLVGISGGKALLAPQCSGLLLGRKDLVEAARLAISPQAGIGRGMKVGKEEIVGLLAAVERYLKVDHAAEHQEMERRANYIIRALAGVQGVNARLYIPEIENHVPHVMIDWDEQTRGRTSEEVLHALIQGEPPIAVSRMGEGSLRVSVWMMRGDEYRIVARRLQETLTRA